MSAHAHVNLLTETKDPACLDLISPTDAWNHMLLPLRMEQGRLICATTRETAAGAAALLGRNLSTPFDFVIAEAHLLEQFIAEQYEYEGVEIAE